MLERRRYKEGIDIVNRNDQKPVIIFDGDDTLWKTQELYELAKTRFNELMLKQGFHDILEFFNNLDADRVSSVMFSKSRFFESMLITYAMLCERYHRKWNISIDSEICKLGLSVFDFPPQLYDDTLLTLRILSKHGSLILFTNGDEEIQRAKIRSLGKRFSSHFFRIYIPEMKTKENYEKIISDINVPASRIWVIGNSVKSDINPAVKLGLKSILIPRGSWKYEESECLSGNITIVSSLTEAAEIIMQVK